MSSIPEPHPGDIFYDIEGDPHYEGCLEHLHGVWRDGQFQVFWIHDHAVEAQALEAFLRFQGAARYLSRSAHTRSTLPSRSKSLEEVQRD